ncbi:MAG: hypothetical protein IPK99_07605 [Flavobacteriales bacterium]|nr:hypothetical protein [Flavobacteriales bacterium]
MKHRTESLSPTLATPLAAWVVMGWRVRGAGRGAVLPDTSAQNLVNNPGFETYTTPPNNYAQICRATGWSSPSGACSLVVGTGSPEFYHTAGTGGAKPPATYWANLMPHSGGGMSAICPWYWTNTNFREYIRTFLAAPLVVGQTYEVSFWLTNGVSSIHPYGVDHIGVAFSMAPLVQVLGNQIVYTPQVELPGVIYSTTWQFHSMTFVATQPYQYVCFGSFVPWGAMTYQYLGASGNSGSLYYIDDITVQAVAALPIELLDFTAACENNAVVLRWSTATETNNYHFAVERSADAEVWETIGTVPGAGNSQQVVHYAFNDTEVAATVLYYRIGQTDFNGTISYSTVAAVPACGDKEVLRQWLVDGQGRLCGTWPAAQGSLSPGIYLVRMEYSDGSSATKKVFLITP